MKKKAEKTKKVSGIPEPAEGKKSYTRLFWEKYPNGILEIVNMKAVLR
jgi:hypothetical protein